MPAKLDASENLRFLYACFQSAEPNRVDYGEVGRQFGIQSAAARMRLLRLREQLVGKQETKHRKRRSSPGNGGKQRNHKNSRTKEGLETDWNGMPDDEDDEEIIVAGSMKKDESNDEKNWKPISREPFPLNQMPLQYSVGAATGAINLPPRDYYPFSQPPKPAQMPPPISTNLSTTQAYPSPQVAAAKAPYFTSVKDEPCQDQGQSQQLVKFSTAAPADSQATHTDGGGCEKTVQ